MKSQTLNAPARACLAVLPIILLLSSPVSAETPAGIDVVELKAEAILPGPNITLGDVADVAGPDANALVRADLGPVPWPGTKRLIDPTVVKIKLYRDNFDLRKVTITGNGCIVSTRTVTVPGVEILEVARKLLMERLPWPAEDVHVEVEAPPEDREVAAGSGRPTLEACMAGSVASGGRARVLVTGKSADCALFRTTVCFRIHVFHTVIVARRDIHQGETFTEDNTVGRRLDVTTLSPSSLYSDAAALMNKKVARSIRAGMPIARQMVIIPPAVRRDSLVQIVFRTEFLSLSARGRAKESGAPGQMIRVENIGSGREVIGQVTADGQVSVAF